MSLALLFLVRAPFWALLLAILSDGIAAVPTVIAVTKNPASESRAGWSIFLAGAFLNLFAVKTWNFQEAGYTIYLIVVIGYICAHAWRRRGPTDPTSGPRRISAAESAPGLGSEAKREPVESF